MLEHYLRCYSTYWQDNWDSLLPAAILAINNCTAMSTGLSPFLLTHSYNVDLLNIAPDKDLQAAGQSPVACREAFVAKLKEATEMAQAAMAAA